MKKKKRRNFANKSPKELLYGSKLKRAKNILDIDSASTGNDLIYIIDYFDPESICDSKVFCVGTDVFCSVARPREHFKGRLLDVKFDYKYEVQRTNRII